VNRSYPHLTAHAPRIAYIDPRTPYCVKRGYRLTRPTQHEGTATSAAQKGVETATGYLGLDTKLRKKQAGAFIELRAVRKNGYPRLEHQTAQRPPGKKNGSRCSGPGAG
jgi:hypothetical protein